MEPKIMFLLRVNVPLLRKLNAVKDLYILNMITLWAMGHSRLNSSFDPYYRQCLRFMLIDCAGTTPQLSFPEKSEQIKSKISLDLYLM